MKNKKMSFFKRIKNAITNFEGYSDFAIEKLSVAIKYIAKLTLIFPIIMAILFSYKFSEFINDEEQIQIMTNQLQETAGLDAKTIEESIQLIKSNNNTTTFYTTLTAVTFLYFFSGNFIYNLISALIVSVIGLIISRLARIRLKYKPIYIMSIYALTLSIILNCIYSIVNILTGFTIDYFTIVYDVLAYIYIVTAILMIKTDFIEQQRELIKIMEEQRKIKEEKRQENPVEEPEEDKKEEKKEKGKGKEENKPTGEKTLGEANTESEI